MSASQLPIEDYKFLDRAEYLHQARLLKYLHSARPLMHEGREVFVQVANARLAGGRVEMTVYLTSGPEPIDSKQIILPAPATEQRKDDDGSQ